MSVRLHVNVDHVATVRQARGTDYPDPVTAALLCEKAGAHGITAHLREDRRHVVDSDIARLKASVTTVFNLEMANTEEMVRIAQKTAPDLVTLVPEKREERTTEGGLDVVGNREALQASVLALQACGIRVNLFIDPSEEQIRASSELGATGIELHTGDYANCSGEAQSRELDGLARGATLAKSLGLEVAAGHGLTQGNTAPLIAAVPEIEELNIGHALVADAIFVGMEGAVKAYLRAMGMRG